MFLEEIKKTVKGKTYKSVLIRETFRVGPVVHHRTLANLSKLPDDQIEKIKSALDKKTSPHARGSKLQDIQLLCSKEYGASYSVLHVLKKLKLDTLIASRKTDWRSNILAMILGRIIFQGSKLSLVNKYLDTKLWELCGHPVNERPDVNQHCYTPLDKLLQKQKNIQKKLAKKHITDGSLVLYDLSSSYVTGEYEDSDFIKYGYSRDKKRGLQQVNFGLLTTEEGCPVSIEVFAGNTCDQSTVGAQTKRIKEEFGVKTIVFVGDRGMLTPKRIQEVNDKGFYTITALTHAQMHDLLKRDIISCEQFHQKSTTAVYEPNNATGHYKIRYVLCFNPHREMKDKATRQSLIEKTEVALEKIRNRKRKKDVQSICAAIGKVWKGYKTEKYFNWTVSMDGTLTYVRKEEIIDSEKCLDGCYVIRTDVPESELATNKVRESYRKLSQVELAFRYIKTAGLDLRPIHHHIDNRIRAHIFLCMLAYYVQWHMLKALRPILAQPKQGQQRRWSFHQIIERLKSIRIQNCVIEGVVIQDLKSIPDDEQQKLLDCLGVSL